jgi:hypothetical protein
VKVLELATSSRLTEKALEAAFERVAGDRHDGWADLIVHQSQLRVALRLANAHNLKKPAIRLRVLAETRMGQDDWKLRTASVEVRVQWERA